MPNIEPIVEDDLSNKDAIDILDECLAAFSNILLE